MGKQELQVARSARFMPVLQIATNKQQTNKQTKKKTNRRTKKKTIWSNKQEEKKGYQSRKMVLNQGQAVKIRQENSQTIFRVQGIAIN